jgi:Uma2 family endonuclease
MSAILRRKYWTLELLVQEFGPIELNKPVSKDTFGKMAERYPDLQMEREPNGTVTLISPIKRGTGRRENRLNFLVNVWNEQYGNGGEVYGPNGSYDLPNGATKMPDVSWISPERLANMPDDEETYIQIVPDFVAEIMSATDRTTRALEKMTDVWIANGVRLAWLIDPYHEKAYIFKQGQPSASIVEGFDDHILSGEDVLVRFELKLSEMKRRVA